MAGRRRARDHVHPGRARLDRRRPALAAGDAELRVISAGRFRRFVREVVGGKCGGPRSGMDFHPARTGLALRRADAGVAVLPAWPAWSGRAAGSLGLSLNVSNLIAASSCSSLHRLRHLHGLCPRRGCGATRSAGDVSALTRPWRAVLLIADHPAFLSIGVTLVFGWARAILRLLVLPPSDLVPAPQSADADAAKEGGAMKKAYRLLGHGRPLAVGLRDGAVSPAGAVRGTGVAPERCRGLRGRLAPRFEQPRRWLPLLPARNRRAGLSLRGQGGGDVRDGLPESGRISGSNWSEQTASIARFVARNREIWRERPGGGTD